MKERNVRFGIEPVEGADQGSTNRFPGLCSWRWLATVYLACRASRKRPAVWVTPFLVALALGLSAWNGSAATDICGTIVGEHWTKTGSPYNVLCDIFVAEVEIDPGVTVNFSGNYNFEIAGVITAIGTAAEPIVFRGTNGWQGIFFNEAMSGSELTYCVISNSVNSGVRVANSSPVLRNCTIAYNTATYGGGLYANVGTNNTLTMEDCLIRNNTANPASSSGTYYGGGLYVSGNSLLKNCTVRDNVCQAYAGSYQACSAQGGGFYSVGGCADLRNCFLFANQSVSGNAGYGSSSSSYGGGLFVASGSLWVTNTIAGSNVASAGSAAAGGIYIDSGVVTAAVVNCTMAYNNIEGLVSAKAGVLVMNSILFFNNGGGTQLSGTTNVTYCDVQGGFLGTGNINYNPVFLSTANLMIVPGSMCIDAGNPAPLYNDLCLPPSLGTARNDIGAHGGPGACAWPPPFGSPRDPVLTNVAGTVVNETWTKANSPYYITGNVQVAGLSIQAGVQVIVLSNCLFEVAGSIAGIGTASEPVVFLGTNGGWQGIYFNHANPGCELNCCIISNSVNSGVRVINSSPVLRNCTIAFNTAAYGGGLYANVGTNNTVTLEACLIRNNMANPASSSGTYYGGGLYVSGNSLLKNCTVRDNVCQAYAGSYQACSVRGGGFYSVGGCADLRNCFLFANQSVSGNAGYGSSSSSYGGGLFVASGSLWVTNTIAGSNVASAGSAAAGGIYIDSGVVTAAVVNCTMAYNNIEGLVSAKAGVLVMNSILFFNNGGGTQLSGTTNVTYCDVQGGFLGTGNINYNPVFLSTANLMIVPGSMCIDAGNPAPLYNDLCLPPSLGTARNDIGAHGGPGACAWPPPFGSPRDPVLTNVAGTVVNETWTKANSPYYITGNVQVAGLSIQAGVQVIVLSNCLFEVAGSIAGIGTASEPVVFLGTNGGWQGIYFNHANPGCELNCCIISNSVNSGVRVINSSPVLRNCTIAFNTATYGGGIYASVGTNNTLTLDHCLIRNNTANPGNYSGTYCGGGLYVSGNSLLKNCTVRDNLCQAYAGSYQGCSVQGGGFYSVGGRADLRNCVLFANQSVSGNAGYGSSSSSYGGGLFVASGSLWATNSILGSNVTSAGSAAAAGGIYIDSGVVSAAVVNCTLAYNNIEGLVTAKAGVPVMNSILYWNNSGGTQLSGTTNVTYCDVQAPSVLPGIGNTNVNPILRGMTATNMIIVPPSHCIDGGNPDPAYNDLCFPPSLGTARNDIGAHGGPGACGWNSTPAPATPGILQLVTTSISLLESGLTASLGVSRSGGSDGAVSVSFATANASAVAGADYLATNGVLNWADGDTGTKSVVVSILNDAVEEPDENFTVSLFTPIGGAGLSNATAVVTIINDDYYVQPASLAVIQGGSATFSITPAASVQSLQWLKDGVLKPGATSATLALTNVQLADAGGYSVALITVAGAVTSSVATLSVSIPPTIIAPPVGLTVRPGSNATFCVTATGTPAPSLQWQFNGGNIPGATGSCLTVTNAQRSNAGNYTVVASNPAGSVTSTPPAVLVVNTPPYWVSTPITNATVGQQYAYYLQAVDPDGDPLTIRAVTLPSWLALDCSGGVHAKSASIGPDSGTALAQTYSVAAAPAPPSAATASPAVSAPATTRTEVAGEAAKALAVSASVPVSQPVNYPGEGLIQPTAKSQEPFNPALALPTPASKAAGKSGSSGLITVNPLATQFPDISLFVTVLDASSNVVTGLGQSAFTVTEQSSAEGSATTEKIIGFQMATNQGISFSLVCDVSGSMGMPINKLNDAKTAAINFLANAGSRDRGNLVTFSSYNEVQTVLASDWVSADSNHDGVNNLTEAIQGLGALDSTALFDGTALGIASLSQEPTPKAVIVFTDGLANDDVLYTINTVITKARNEGVPLYTIGLGSDADTNVLTTMAQQTGGTFHYAPTAADMAAVYQAIAREVRSSYQLRYTTHNPNYDGTLRTVTVSANSTTGVGAYRVDFRPVVTLSPATLALSSNSQPSGVALNIAGNILDLDAAPQTQTVSAVLFYRQVNASNYTQQAMTVTATSNGYYNFSAAIPASAAQAPGVNYYVWVSDAVLEVYVPFNYGVSPFSIAVQPNHAPVITHTPVLSAPASSPLGISAVVVDNDAGDSVSQVMLYYRIHDPLQNAPYYSTAMNSSGGSNYFGVIPADQVTTAGVDYYISAWDSRGVRADAGGPLQPYFVTVGGCRLVGTPAAANVGTHLVVLEISDGYTTVQQTFTITVTGTNELVATHAMPYYVPGATNTVNCQVTYSAGRRLLSLVWLPNLPAGWQVVGAAGDGNPEVNNGQILLTAFTLGNPLNFTYSVFVPAGETASREVRGTVVYFLDGAVNGAVIPAMPNPLVVPLQPRYHTADYEDARWVIDTLEVNRVLTYWRAQAYHHDTNGLDGYASGAGLTNGALHSADYRAPFWLIDGTEVNRVLSFWRAGAYHADPTAPDGYAPGATIKALEKAGVVPPSIAQFGAAVYPPGGVLQITNVISYNTPLLSLLLRPFMPAGWTLLSVSGQGNPEMVAGEIVWTGAIPPSPIQVVYSVQTSAGDRSVKSLRAELEYEFSGMIAAQTNAATPNPLTLGTVQMIPAGIQNGLLTLRLAGESGRSYRIQSATEVKSSPNFTQWTDLVTNVATGGAIQFSRPATNAHLFYRALLVQ